MMLQQVSVEEIDDIAVVTVEDEFMTDERRVKAFEDVLLSLIEERGHRFLVLDFHIVKYFGSATVEVLFKIERTIRHVRGRFTLCGLIPTIFELFEINRTNLLFKILPTREEALKWLREARAGRSFAIQTRCPGFGCGELITTTHPEDHRDPRLRANWDETCARCGLGLSLEGHLPNPGETNEAVVQSITAATYEGESVVLHPDRREYGPPSFRYGHITVHGRLDLFAAEAVERLWRSLTTPRWAALDLRKATEISARGIAHLADVHATDPPNFPAAVVAGDGAASLIPACFPRVADPAELGRALAQPARPYGSQSLTTTVERAAGK